MRAIQCCTFVILIACKIRDARAVPQGQLDNADKPPHLALFVIQLGSILTHLAQTAHLVCWEQATVLGLR